MVMQVAEVARLCRRVTVGGGSRGESLGLGRGSTARGQSNGNHRMVSEGRVVVGHLKSSLAQL